MAGALPERAVLPVAGDRAVDEARVAFRERVVAHAQPLHHARPEALDEDVVVLREPKQDVARGRLLQVEPQGALVAIERQEVGRRRAVLLLLLAAVVGRHPADVVAAGRVLDLEDLGSEVGQQQGAEAARQKPGEVEDPQSLERPVACFLAHRAAAVAAAFGGQVIFTVPSRTLASSTVATRLPVSSTIWRAFAIRSPFERAIAPSGR